MLKVEKTNRGFGIIRHKPFFHMSYNSPTRLVQESSLDLKNSNTAHLWVGEEHHLNRDEVKQLIEHLQHWVDTGSLL